MLAGLVLPPGARRVGYRAVPERAEVIASPNLADVSRFYLIPAPMDAVASFLSKHVPAADKLTGTGTESAGAGAAVGKSVSYTLKAAPPGIAAESMLLASLASGPHGGTVMRADAEVVWYPPRSAAEYVSPGGYRQARGSASFMSPRPRTFRRVITTRAEIARLARLLDGLHAAGPLVVHCPMIDATYRLTFRDSASGRPVVKASATVCLTIAMTVGGKAQPALWGSDKLITAIRALLGVSSRYR